MDQSKANGMKWTKMD